MKAMIKRPIRNIHSSKQNPPRVFDVIVEDGKIIIEIKTEKHGYERILWEDIVYQVEAAKKIASTTQ